jgi:hypothetical protein
MIKIAAYTVGDIGVASSRLRSFYLFQSSSDYGVNVFRNLSIRQSLTCDCLHLQKSYKPKHIAQALLFRLLGKKVIFDIDDNPKGKYKVATIVLMRIANVVTTDTDLRREYFSKYVNKNKIFVLPDVLDIAPDKADQVISRKNSRSKGIFWIGHRDNLGSIEKLLDVIADRADYHMVVATKLAQNDVLHTKYPKVTFIDWRLDVSLDPDIDVVYMILNHDTGVDPDAIYKSENKMVLSIASGLIPIVSRTPAYEMLAQTLDAERLIFNELDEVFSIIESLDPIWLQHFMTRARKYILDNYTDKRVFLKFKAQCMKINNLSGRVID